MALDKSSRGALTNRQITIDALPVTKDAITNDNGHLVVNAFLSRPGVFNYLASEIKSQWKSCDAVQQFPDDAILRAYRPPAELAKPQYLRSAELIPVTDDHPADMMHPDTVGGHPVGVSAEGVKIVDGKPQAKLVLWSQDAIDAYHSGKKEISLGAYNRFVWGPGKTADDEPYDFQIVDTTNNHIAMVDRGRAGPSARIFDSAPESREGKKTMEVKIKNATFDIDDNAAKLLDAERTEHKATVDKLRGENEALKNRKMTDDEIGKLVDAEIEKRAAAKELNEHRQAVKDAGFDVEGKSDDYVSGIFETLDKNGSPEAGTNDNAGVSFGSKTTDKVTRAQVTQAKANVYN